MIIFDSLDIFVVKKKIKEILLTLIFMKILFYGKFDPISLNL